MGIKSKILDLFSGAGGFSYGMEMNPNFETLIAVDNNYVALNTLKYNIPKAEIICGDICDDKIKENIISISKNKKINMIIGGPPCQGFSLKGKKMGLNDPRNFLFLEYYDLVKKIKPKIFIIENVKSMTTTSNGFFINEIKKIFTKLGYFVNSEIINSVNFGVPQNRERTVIIGSLEKNIKLPTVLSTKKNTVRDAISDLAYLKSNEGKTEDDYLYDANTEYQKLMRKYSKKLYNHKSTNHNKIALYKLSLIPPEKGKEFLPKELVGKQKFNTTWSRLEWDKPSPTIDTRFDTPSNGKNSHPFLNRAITPREAARLQSFPDNFIFFGNKTEICKQIGNAVPPLLAKNIADSIIAQLTKEKYITNSVELYNDDAYTIIFDFLKKDKKINHIITDPPYNISIKNNFNTLKNPRIGLDFGGWDKNFDLYSWITDYSKILDKNGSFIIFCSYKFISYIIAKMEENNIVVKDVIKWIKTNPMPRNRDRRYVQDTEFAIWGIKKGAKWVFNRNTNAPYLRAEYHTSVVSGKERTIHPTQKSLELLRQIISIHTNENDIILDPFMGSGTTGIAAQELGRQFIGVEVEKKYYDIAKKRIQLVNKKYISEEYGFNKLYALLINFYETNEELDFYDYLIEKYNDNKILEFNKYIKYNEKIMNLLKDFIYMKGVKLTDILGDSSDFNRINFYELNEYMKKNLGF